MPELSADYKARLARLADRSKNGTLNSNNQDLKFMRTKTHVAGVSAALNDLTVNEV